MVTGIECVGLCLAVLPVVIEAAKSYQKGVNTIVDVVGHSHRDEKLEEFYEDFYWEVYFVERKIREVVEALPYLSDARKAELTAPEHLAEWTIGSDVTEALSDYFKSESDLNAFMVIMKKITQLLAGLVKDSSVRTSREDVDQSNMYNKLKDFQKERREKKASSTFKERFRFWKKEKDRAKSLMMLETWNRRLCCLTEGARKEPAVKKSRLTNPKEYCHHSRALSRVLYKALVKHWRCSCAVPHEVKFCLKQTGASTKEPEEADLYFDFLFSKAADMQSSWTWQEAIAIVRTKRDAKTYDSAVIHRICDAFRSGVSSFCMQFLIDGTSDEQKMWQLRPQPKRLQLLETVPSVSLHSLLLETTHLPLLTKRRLALILADSLLRLGESHWPRSGWNKGQITFFYESTNSLDYQRPYVTPSFDDVNADHGDVNIHMFHRNPSILALGILLIEIHTGNPIETYRQPQDLTDGQEANANTDWIVADRVVKSLDDCSIGYRGAIQACLDTPWMPAGSRVSLEDPETRNGVYSEIVRPLEDELEYLFKEKF